MFKSFKINQKHVILSIQLLFYTLIIIRNGSLAANQHEWFLKDHVTMLKK